MAALGFVLLATGACQEPTQVELRLWTDLPCDGVQGTAVTVGRRGELEVALPSASLTVCEPGADGRQHLGLVVLVPRDGPPDDPIAVKVVAALTPRSVDDCKPGEVEGRGYQGCVVARRELRYWPGHTLRLEVPMLQQCQGVECTVNSTCFDATTCIPAEVTCRQEACTVNDTPSVRFPNPWEKPAGSGGSSGNPGGSGGGGPGGAGGEVGASGNAGGGEPGVGGSVGGPAGAGGGSGGVAGSSGGGGDGGTAGDGGPPMSQVATGGRHSCAIVDNGDVRCWGWNGAGQLGEGTQTDRPTPAPVRLSLGGPPLTGVQALALGDYHSCALLNGGEMRCWGRNVYGQLGDGTQTNRLTPTLVLQVPGGPPLTDMQALALGPFHSCALLSGGEVRCWGFNISGQLGDGTLKNQHTPVPVVQALGGPALTDVQVLALGMYHSCALLRGGEVRCWGRNDHGQLGDGTTTDRLSPVAVRQSPGDSTLTGVQALALGDAHSCALLTNGESHCWGWNGYGQLGNSTQMDQLTPVPVRQSSGVPLTGVQALALGTYHSCALLTNGESHCWGWNYYGQLGDGMQADRLTPRPVLQSLEGAPLTGAQGLDLGGDHSCALLSGGKVRCWGRNDRGQLGDGMTANQPNPVLVLFESGAISPLRARPSARSASNEWWTLGFLLR